MFLLTEKPLGSRMMEERVPLSPQQRDYNASFRENEALLHLAAFELYHGVQVTH